MSVILSQFSAAAITTNDITYIAVVPNGNIYVVGGSFQIFVYSPTGTYLNTITTSDYISHFTIDYSNNLVYCSGVSSFFVVDIATNTVTFTYSSGWLNGLAYSSDGFVYATTNSGYIIQKINPSNGTQSTIFTSSNGNIISDSYGTFANCVLDDNEYLYCVTRGVGYVYKFTRTGSLIGLFSMVNVAANGITFDPTNQIFYVTSTNTNELYIINKYGQKYLYSSLNGSSYGTFYDKISKKVYVTSRPKTVYTITPYVPIVSRYNINNSNLRYYYPLDTDLLNYASGTGVNDATYTRTITTAASILTSGSLDLNGTSNMFKVPGHSYQAGGVTICMWMKSKTLTPNWYHLFSFGNGQGNDNILLGFTGSDVGNLRVFYILFNGGSQLFRTNLAYQIPDLNWHHYCVTINANGAWNIYIDGVNQSVTDVGYPNTVTRATCYIGNSHWADPGMVAYINQILIFNRTLTSTEVFYLATAPASVQFSSSPTTYAQPNNRYNINNSNLLYYYPFNNDTLDYASGVGVSNATITSVSISSSTTVISSGSLLLPGTSSQIVKLPNIQFGADGITIALWMKCVSIPTNWMRIFDFAKGPSNNEIYLGFPSGGSMQMGFYNPSIGSQGNYNLNYSISDTNWHHYVFTISSIGTISLYVDGVSITNSISTKQYPSRLLLTENYLGKSFYETDGYLNAYMNQFLVFNRTITSAEILYLANYPTGIQFSSLPTQLIDDSYTTNPQSLSYGMPFQLIYSGSNFVLNATYVLKLDSTTVDTQINTGPTITFNVDIPGTYSATLQIYDSSGTAFGISINLTFTYPCFLEGSKILRLNIDIDEEEYIAVEHLKTGDIIKTATCGYKAIAFIGKSILKRPVDDPNKKNRLYVFNKKKCPGVFKDLCITGEHCTLHKSLTPEKQRQVREYMGDNYITESFHRVPACLDERAEPYTGANTGPVTIWHFALEHNNLYNNYAVYANGLLVETCSIDFLKNKSGMELM